MYSLNYKLVLVFEKFNFINGKCNWNTYMQEIPDKNTNNKRRT